MENKINWRALDVSRSSKYDTLVNRFCSTKSNSALGQEMIFKTGKELMVFSALVGFELSLFEPIEKGMQKTGVTLGTFSTDKLDAYIYLMALSKKPELDTLKTENLIEAIKIFEGYCNGGLRHINDWILSNIENNLGADALFKNTYDFLINNSV